MNLLDVGGPSFGPTTINIVQDGFVEGVKYFAFDIPQNAAFVEIIIDALGPGEFLKAMINPWGGLPCSPNLPDCMPVRSLYSRVMLPWCMLSMKHFFGCIAFAQHDVFRVPGVPTIGMERPHLSRECFSSISGSF